VAGWKRRDQLAAVNCDAVNNVIRIVEKSERTPSPAGNFPQYDEPAARGMRTMILSVIYVVLFVASADRKDMVHLTSHIHDHQDLARKIDFNVWIAGNETILSPHMLQRLYR
jgi:hypothetical protein